MESEQRYYMIWVQNILDYLPITQLRYQVCQDMELQLMNVFQLKLKPVNMIYSI